MFPAAKPALPASAPARGFPSPSRASWGVLGLLLTWFLHAAEPASWESALAGMPFPEGVRELNRTNCVPLMLGAFQSNGVVKALVFLPGGTDEFYHFRRAQARLEVSHPTLRDVVVAITNQTLIRATFRPPFLLFHAIEDPTEPVVEIESEATARKLRERPFIEHLLANDRDWNYLQPILERRLNVFIKPPPGTPESWHFYRHSLAAWHLTQMEALEAVSLAGMTKVTVGRRTLVFSGDTRPRFLKGPRPHDPGPRR